ncbi:MAG: ArgE/DapE family deacylase [Armatimonadota bacterium]|nr:ArgE/DapE family deacylase [Armatimonadota bacterium]
MSHRGDVVPAIRDNAERLIRLTQDLVRINSENHPPDGNEGEVQRYIAAFWAKHGIEFDSFLPTDVAGFKSHPAFYDDGRDYQDRPVVVAKMPGQGGGRSLIFCGHVDTVPAVGEWNHPPYSAVIESGRLYGRGAFDMKGGVAAMMMAAAVLREMGVRLKGDLLIETVPDEEFAGSNGSVAACARGYVADGAVIAEPTAMSVVTGHRGFRLAQVAITGKTGIEIYGEVTMNPVEHLVPVLEGIERFRESRKPITTEDTVMITKLGANEFRRDELFTVPPECRIEVNWQLTPEEEIAEIDREFERVIRDTCASDPYFVANPPEITYHVRPMPGSRIAEDSPLVAEIKHAAEQVTGRRVETIGRFAPCDMFVFNKFAGIPALVFGPNGGGAHGPDEYVLVDDLLTCAEIYVNLAMNWCGMVSE